MLNGLSERIKKLNTIRIKLPGESLLKKLDKMKKASETGISSIDNASPGNTLPDNAALQILPENSEHLKKLDEELNKKIEEIIKSKSAEINASTESIKDFDVRLNKMEGTISTSKNRIDEIKERLDKIDESLLELLSLYEVVSSTVNPFVGEKDNHTSEKIEQIEKKIDALSQKTPEFPSEIKKEYEVKFKALEGSLEVLTQMQESNVMNQEAMIEKVSNQVFERIKPLLDERPKQADTIAAVPRTMKPDQPAHAVIPEFQRGENDVRVKLSYLDNKAETSIILLNWIEFLMEKVGRNNLGDVIEYYIDIGWISEEVASKMMSYAAGIDYYVERPTWKLLPEDHTKSLMFIEQLMGRKIDKNMLSRIGREAEKVILF